MATDETTTITVVSRLRAMHLLRNELRNGVINDVRRDATALNIINAPSEELQQVGQIYFLRRGYRTLQRLFSFKPDATTPVRLQRSYWG